MCPVLLCLYSPVRIRPRESEPVALLCPCPPDDVAPMMMHTHTGASLSAIACVCYPCPSCRLYSFEVGKLYPKEIEAYRSNRSEPVSGRPPDSGRPPVSLSSR